MPVPPTFGVLASSAASSTTWSTTDRAAAITLSGGNLKATAASNGNANVRSTTSKVSGKWHVEFAMITSGHPGYPNVCLSNATFPLTSVPGSDLNCIEYQPSGGVFLNNVQVGTIQTWGSGDLIAMELDVPNGLVFFQVLGHARSSGISYSGLTGSLFCMFGSNFAADAATANFGGSSFSITPTSGFVAWG